MAAGIPCISDERANSLAATGTDPALHYVGSQRFRGGVGTQACRTSHPLRSADRTGPEGR